MNCEVLFHTFITNHLPERSRAGRCRCRGAGGLGHGARVPASAHPGTATAGVARAAPRLQPGAGAHGIGVAGVHAGRIAGGGVSDELD